MTKPAGEIQAEFDRIARASGDDVWSHNNHYHRFLLDHAPAHCAAALDVGCGSGDFARLLAQRSDHVLGVDLSAEMLRIARQQSLAYPNIDYQQADVMLHPLPAGHYDCIASIATLHHLNLADVLPRLSAALKPGGVLLVLDLARDEGLGDSFQTVGGFFLHRILHRRYNRHSAPQSAEARAAWEAHGSDDHPLSVREVRRICADVLPGAQVTRHMLWRYSLVWTKPTD